MIKNREDLMQVRTAAKAHIEDCDCRILVPAPAVLQPVQQRFMRNFWNL